MHLPLPALRACLPKPKALFKFGSPNRCGPGCRAPPPAGRSSRHQFAELGSNPLNSTMEVMLWGDAEHRAMKARVKEW